MDVVHLDAFDGGFQIISPHICLILCNKNLRQLNCYIQTLYVQKPSYKKHPKTKTGFDVQPDNMTSTCLTSSNSGKAVYKCDTL